LSDAISQVRHNSIHLIMTVAGFIFDDAGRVLLIKENYGSRRYGPPGGRVEKNESPQHAVVREVAEETGLSVSVERLIGMYYFADEPSLAFAFLCRIIQGKPVIPATSEIAEVN
jgi:8-oxo-dGTP diphosphatase